MEQQPRLAEVGVTKRGRRPAMSPARVGIETGVVSLVIGALLGVAWYLLAPEISGQATDNGIAIPAEQAQQLFDRVAVFALLAAGAGLVLGLVVAVRHRRRPVSALLSLGIGGFIGSLLAWGVGVWLGPSAGDGAPGAQVIVPMELDTPAALFVWPVAAIVVMTIIMLIRDDRTPWIWNGAHP